VDYPTKKKERKRHQNEHKRAKDRLGIKNPTEEGIKRKGKGAREQELREAAVTLELTRDIGRAIGGLLGYRQLGGGGGGRKTSQNRPLAGGGKQFMRK